MAAQPIAMPRLGMTMEEGTVVQWPIAVDAKVARGVIVLVIETEKAESEIEATVDGVLRHVYVEPGETVPCGALLAAVTDSADDPFDADAFAAAYVPPDGPAAEAGEPAPETSAASEAAPRARAGGGGRKPIAPAARALAKKLGIDPSGIDGTGPNGRVTKADVEAFAARRADLTEVEPGIGLEVLREGHEERAAKGEPVALLPGLGTDVSAFALLTPRLATHFEVIGVNSRGVGHSDAPEADCYTVERAADDVAAVLGGPAHLVGASLGAAVAIELALRHPDRVRSLVLLTPFVEARPRLAAFARAWQRARAEASPAAVAEILAPWLFGDALLGDAAARERVLRGLAQTVQRTSADTLARQAAGLQAWSGSRAGDLSDLSAPTLVLAGGDDLLVPDAASVAAAIPNAKCEVLPGCGHALAIDGADDVALRILAHLKDASHGARST